MRRSERIQTALFGKLLEMWQLSFPHPPADECGIHPIESENDETLRVLACGPSRPKQRRLCERDDRYHGCDREHRSDK
jgi:hypothetical protein